MPPEHVRACNAHESVPTATLDAGIAVRAIPRTEHQHSGSNGVIAGKPEDSAASKDAISDKYSASAAGSNVTQTDVTFEPAADAEYLSLITCEASSTSSDFLWTMDKWSHPRSSPAVTAPLSSYQTTLFKRAGCEFLGAVMTVRKSAK
jgi:hypothetical protein